MADDQEKRAAAAIAKPADTGAGWSSQWGDFKVNWKPYVESEGGFDTNPDNLFTEDGTASSSSRLACARRLSAPTNSTL